jgi:hypothetical protein
MSIVRTIAGRVLLFEVETMDDRKEIRLHKASIGKKSISFSAKEYTGIKSLEKWNHSIAFVFVTGNQVASKQYIQEDASIKKILDNENLLCDIASVGENKERTISFVRKEIIQELLDQLKKNNIPVANVFIGKKENTTIEERLRAYWEKEMSPDVILKSPERLNVFFNMLYYRLQLPILIAFFFVLLGNYFVNSHIRQENETLNIRIDAKRKSNEVRQEGKDKLSRLTKMYREVPSYSLAAVADRIASYVPLHLRLNTLSIHPPTSDAGSIGRRKKDLNMRSNIIIVKGWSDIPGCITLFSQLLSKDATFGKVEIISLTKREDANLFDFELQLTL